MDNTTWTIIILLIVAIGGFLLFGGGASQEGPNQPATSSNATTTQPTENTEATSSPGTQPTATTSDGQSGQQADRPAATVTYENGTFSPQEVTVQKGETVRFVSQGGAMWVGVDQHPTHTQYDGTNLQEHCQDPSTDSFDQCEIGQRFSFTFDKTGQFDYHNHVNPSARGTVIVQ